MKDCIENNIAILLPYDELIELAKTITQELAINIAIEKIVIDNALAVADAYRRRGVEIIVSRGNLAKAIAKNIDVEVINIPFTGYEFFDVLFKYKDFNEPIGIIEGADFIEGCRKINEKLRLDLHYYQVDHVSEFEAKTQQAMADGIELFIGGSWGIEYQDGLKARNIRYEMLHSQKPSVRQAIESAIAVFYAKQREKSRHQVLKTVLDYSQSGILVIDQNDMIINMNAVAEELLKIQLKDCAGRHSKMVLPSLRLYDFLSCEDAEMEQMEAFFGVNVMVDRVPMLVNGEIKGAIAFMHRASQIVNMESSIRKELVERRLTAKYHFTNIIGNSQSVVTTIELAQNFSGTDSTILLTGETGTGKELFAQSIHNASKRAQGPFVAINCSALPANLLESELFGYRDGAFTGAKKGGKMGLFELAHKGTIFLDEIGEIEKSMQAKLLRVLQEQEVMRIGDIRVIPVDVRVIAATNRDLLDEMRQGRYREDLYYRLNVLNLILPPLRERKGDIPILMDSLRKRINQKLDRRVEGFSKDVIQLFEQYSWPGNIRELENVVEKVIVIQQRGIVGESMVSFIRNCFQRQLNDDLKDPFDQTLAAIERQAIEMALKRNDGNRTKAALALGIDRTTLVRKIKLLSIPL
ncbi:sigma 54-interacting transcriptional regulator [Fusibacter paucivorans]|uniref:Sigma 54-interacting transcriptional regulator n=1 Tax=Fusibacter paucivorans TaxID=76009 RepID=A0ABS5PLA0_9FIRM|nr:sigma 54-interacting transcriptional regulator [Fusibacter paucivorans]MBS7525944.1 sigma 54-interacting transcriptional regulator [Fusibacter paucivorans]